MVHQVPALFSVGGTTAFSSKLYLVPDIVNSSQSAIIDSKDSSEEDFTRWTSFLNQ